MDKLDKIRVVAGKIAGDCEKMNAVPIDCIPYKRMSISKGLINASVPLTRRERRTLKRKAKKHGRS